MKGRIPYSERMKQELEEILIEGRGHDLAHPLDAFVRQGARYLLQRALESEMEEFLGRGHYQRGGRRRSGWRNGYEPQNLKTPMGVLTVGAPQVRGTGAPFQSDLLNRVTGDSNDSLSRLAVGMYVRGLSDRDIEDLWVETFGRRVLSKSGTSVLAKQLGRDFDAWRTRDLGGFKIDYLFLDGLFVGLRQGTTEKEGVLAAYGITEDGRKVLVHLALGARESYADWLGFLQDLVGRNLGIPLLVLHDGRPGLIRAIKEVWPTADRQHCQVHKMRNILSKLPKTALGQMKRLVQRVFLAESYEQGLKEGRALVERFKDLYPSAMECLEKDLASCLTYLRFPSEHAKVIRTTNLLERTFGEGRRRTKVIPRFPTERSGLSLVFAVLVRASEKWRGVRMTPAIRRQLDALRQQTGRRGCSDIPPGKIDAHGSSMRVKEMRSVRDSETMHSNAPLVVVG